MKTILFISCFVVGACCGHFLLSHSRYIKQRQAKLQAQTDALRALSNLLKRVDNSMEHAGRLQRKVSDDKRKDALLGAMESLSKRFNNESK